MNYKLLKILSVVVIVFGFTGGFIAFINSYDGFRHFPGITRKKRIRISLEISAGAFFMAIIIGLAVFIMFME